MTQERHFFFRTDGTPLFATLHLPAGGAAGRTALVVCDSLFEEKYWCERVFANLGRAAAAAGAATLLFDYAGYGNSAGEPIDVDPASLVRDAADACRFARDLGASRIVFLGIRWGAAVASAAAGVAGADALVLVQPIRDWSPELMKALRANVAGQYAIFRKTVMTREQIIGELAAGGACEHGGYHMNNVEGYLFSHRFVEGAREMTLPATTGTDIPVTIVRIPEKAGAPVRDDGLADAIRAGGATCEEIVIPDDNAFWINNRIFTSRAPGFVEAIVSRLAGGGRGEAGAPATGDARPAGGGPKEQERADAPAVVAMAGDDLPGAADAVTIGGVREEAVVLDGGETGPVAGVMYRPDGAARETGVVFTHGGLIGMNGAFRFNTRAARRLAAAGFPCLCADTHGVGRSGSRLGNVEQRVLFRWICNGLFADDVVAAARLLRERSGARRIAAVGVCGGAITNLIAQSRSAEIDDSVLLSIPVMLPSLRYGEVRMSEGYARFYLGLYLRKIFNLRAWWRFLTFRSEYDKIFAALGGFLAGLSRRIGGSANRRPAPPPAKPAAKSGLSVTVPGAGEDMSFNDDFLRAYRAIVGRGGQIDFVFGEHDNFRWEFESEFLARMPGEIERGRGLVTIESIEHANHMYTLREWQDEIVRRCAARFSGGD
ncbi:MAG: alpha/beta hydrolase [Candidatus Krumholzibacteriota bacterium]|nr:alpha/beta hydrolase [Candidatus Krumholzibacteriota bacterium]